jgi:hypothetical protein
MPWVIGRKAEAIRIRKTRCKTIKWMAKVINPTGTKKFVPFLRGLIIAGRAKPSFIVSHRMPLSGASEAMRSSIIAAWVKVRPTPRY